jgi:hypothetical protein
MKKMSEVEENLFTSSLNICPEACSRKGWGGGRSNASPSPPSYFPDDILLEDDVTVILFLGFSFVALQSLPPNPFSAVECFLFKFTDDIRLGLFSPPWIQQPQVACKRRIQPKGIVV